MPGGIPSQPSHHSVPAWIPGKDSLTKDSAPHELVQNEGKARAKQAEITRSLENILKKKKIGAESIFSRDALRGIFGKSSLKAKVKDRAVHLLHKISDRLVPGSPGSHFMESKRLTDLYQKQMTGGASPDEKIRTLQALKNELTAHLGDVSTEPAKSYLELVDAEIFLLEIALFQEGHELSARIDTLESRMLLQQKFQYPIMQHPSASPIKKL